MVKRRSVRKVRSRSPKRRVRSKSPKRSRRVRSRSPKRRVRSRSPKRRKLSAYNRFMSKEIKKLRSKSPGKSHKAIFKAAAGNWRK